MSTTRSRQFVLRWPAGALSARSTVRGRIVGGLTGPRCTGTTTTGGRGARTGPAEGASRTGAAAAGGWAGAGSLTGTGGLPGVGALTGAGGLADGGALASAGALAGAGASAGAWAPVGAAGLAE